MRGTAKAVGSPQPPKGIRKPFEEESSINIGVPEKVGFSSSRLDRIQTAMQALVDEGKIPGAVTLIARRGQVVHTGSFGMRDIELNKPMQFDYLFPIFSMTKPVTATAVMMHYEQGYFQLTDPISRFLPEFKGGKVIVKTSETGIELIDREREITIYDLLTQTSGLINDIWGGHSVIQLIEESGLNSPNLTLAGLAKTIARLPGLHQPGKAWQYGEAFDILARLVEVVAGRPFEVFLKQEIFEPLGMVDTGFYGSREGGERFVKFYGFSETGGLIEAAALPRLEPSTVSHGGFGLISTAEDYFRFSQMLLNGGELDGKRLLGRKTVHYMTQNHLPDEWIPIQLSSGFSLNGYGYGLGFRVLTDAIQLRGLGSVGEYGWYGYGGTYFWIDPEEEMIGIILLHIEPFSSLQFDPIGYFTIINKFRSLTYQAIID
jgi:CubicO group peptidase (beta-lactamase class C family)